MVWLRVGVGVYEIGDCFGKMMVGLKVEREGVGIDMGVCFSIIG